MARLPSPWPVTMTPELECTPAAVTGPLAGVDRNVWPRSRSQSFTVLSALAVKAWEPARRKPQALRGPRWPRSVCCNRCARRSRSRMAWSEEAAKSNPDPGERSTATSRGKSRETERCACSRAVVPSSNFTNPSAVPMATRFLGKGAPCMPAAAMHVSSASWILRKTRCFAGSTGASLAAFSPPRLLPFSLAASASRKRVSSERRRSVSEVFACNSCCVRSNCALSSAFSRPSNVACRQTAV
mmetsp:Transcript_16736/g.45415  ORF Transcript_16736/g.45415 Transcript_16736/m.45415 type:complete len:242 (+) Transcript_16736:320-1045(+)